MHGPNENRDRQHAVVRILQRLGTLAATAFLGVLLTATLVRNSPGFDADERLLDARLDDASRAAIRAEHAANHDVLGFYKRYLGGMLHGDFGTSPSLNRPI